MDKNHYKHLLTEFQSNVFELLSEIPQDRSSLRPEILIYLGKNAPNIISSLKNKLTPETFVLFLYPPSQNSTVPNLQPDIVQHQILFSAITGESLFKEKVGIFITLLATDNIQLSISEELKNIFANEIEAIKETIEISISNLKQSSRGRLVYLRNSIVNLPMILSKNSVQAELSSTEIPAIICSAGPSLKDNLASLKKYEQNLIVICIGRTAPALMEFGIPPDFIVEVDPTDYSWKKHSLKPNCPLVATVSVSPDVAKKFSRLIWGYGDSQAFNRKLQELNTNLFPLHTSRTVTVSAIDFAIKIGCTNIALIGNDLCMNNELKYHIGDTEAQKNTSSMFEVEGNNGKKVMTTKGFNALKKAIEAYISSAKDKCENIRFFNCTENGAVIKHTEFLKFSTFCKNLSVEKTKKIKLITEKTPSDIAHQISIIADDCNQYVKIVSQMLTSAKLLLSEVNNLNSAKENLLKYQQQLEELSQKEAEQKNKNSIGGLIRVVEKQLDDIFHEIPKKTIQDNDAVAQIKDFIKRYNLLYDLCKDIYNDLEYVKAELSKDAKRSKPNPQQLQLQIF